MDPLEPPTPEPPTVGGDTVFAEGESQEETLRTALVTALLESGERLRLPQVSNQAPRSMAALPG